MLCPIHILIVRVQIQVISGIRTYTKPELVIRRKFILELEKVKQLVTSCQKLTMTISNTNLVDDNFKVINKITVLEEDEKLIELDNLNQKFLLTNLSICKCLL